MRQCASEARAYRVFRPSVEGCDWGPHPEGGEAPEGWGPKSHPDTRGQKPYTHEQERVHCHYLSKADCHKHLYLHYKLNPGNLTTGFGFLTFLLPLRILPSCLALEKSARYTKSCDQIGWIQFILIIRSYILIIRSDIYIDNWKPYHLQNIPFKIPLSFNLIAVAQW